MVFVLYSGVITNLRLLFVFFKQNEERRDTLYLTDGSCEWDVILRGPLVPQRQDLLSIMCICSLSGRGSVDNTHSVRTIRSTPNEKVTVAESK